MKRVQRSDSQPGCMLAGQLNARLEYTVRHVGVFPQIGTQVLLKLLQYLLRLTGSDRTPKHLLQDGVRGFGVVQRREP